ncbi:hypothetical protein, partial [Rhodovulum sulfidophilum]|uniref:hypothetical protein n=1 Tax=Rhodovulum sulfidophilum TaxID=35806 RepID=UPI001F404549
MAALGRDFGEIERPPSFWPSGDARRKRFSRFCNRHEQVGLPFSGTNFCQIDVEIADWAGLEFLRRPLCSGCIDFRRPACFRV